MAGPSAILAEGVILPSESPRFPGVTTNARTAIASETDRLVTRMITSSRPMEESSHRAAEAVDLMRHAETKQKMGTVVVGAECGRDAHRGAATGPRHARRNVVGSVVEPEIGRASCRERV